MKAVRVGQRFHNWEVLSRSPNKSKYWRCRCHCGTCSSIVRDVATTNLTSGKSTECGKRRDDQASARQRSKWDLTGTTTSFGVTVGEVIAQMIAGKKTRVYACSCPVGHQFSATSQVLRRMLGCPECGKLSKRAAGKARAPRYDVMGRMMTVVEMAEFLGLSREGVARRLRLMTPQELIILPRLRRPGSTAPLPVKDSHEQQ